MPSSEPFDSDSTGLPAGAVSTGRAPSNALIETVFDTSMIPSG
jgi:hypothetical protein